MTELVIKAGDRLQAIWGPSDNEGNQFGARTDSGSPEFCRVSEIWVGKAEGPMGFYLVACIVRVGEAPLFMPLHMAETFTLADPGEVVTDA